MSHKHKEDIGIEKKQTTYRGKTIEELKNLNVREFAKYLKSRARRNVLRQFREIENFVDNCKKKIEKGKPIRTHKRTIVIVPQMIGMTIYVYNGKSFMQVKISESMLGHRLGEFALTRARIRHGTAGIGSTKGSKHKSKK